MKGLLVTLSSDFILQATGIPKTRRDVVRFGYRKITPVAPWKVEEKGPGRGKEASSTKGLLSESNESTVRAWMKAGASRLERKRYPNVIFLQTSLTSFFLVHVHVKQLKTDT